MLDESFQRIAKHAQDSARLTTAFFDVHGTHLVAAARHMAVAFARGHRVYFIGSGASVLLAERGAALLAECYLMQRPPLPALVLNGFGAEGSVAQQVRTQLTTGDILVALAATEPCATFMDAVHLAHAQKVLTIGIVSSAGSRDTLGELCTLLLCAPHLSPPLVHECHTVAVNMLCSLVDYYLFENVMAIKDMINA